MLRIPDYRSLKTEPGPGTVAVTVEIDGSSNMAPGICMGPEVVQRLKAAFAAGDLNFMSFEEHPKRLTGIASAKRGKVVSLKITARSLTETDRFPTEWDYADPGLLGAKSFEE